MQKYLDALIKTLRTPEDAARALANVLVFESLASDEMKKIRDTTLPSVLSWAESAAVPLPSVAKPSRFSGDVPERVLELVGKNPGIGVSDLRELIPDATAASIDAATRKAVIRGTLRRARGPGSTWRYFSNRALESAPDFPDFSSASPEPEEVKVDAKKNRDTPKRVLKLLELRSSGLTLNQIHERLGGSFCTVQSAVKRAFHGHLLRKKDALLGQWVYTLKEPGETTPEPEPVLQAVVEVAKGPLRRAPKGHAKTAFEYVKLHPKSTSKQVREGANLPYVSVQCSLRSMEKRGLLIREASDVKTNSGIPIWLYSVPGFEAAGV